MNQEVRGKIWKKYFWIAHTNEFLQTNFQMSCSSSSVSIWLSGEIFQNLEFCWYSSPSKSMWNYMQAFKLTENWYTSTLNHGKCFVIFFEFFASFLESENIFGFHRLEGSKNRMSWIREQLKNFEKLILEFPIRKSS